MWIGTIYSKFKNERVDAFNIGLKLFNSFHIEFSIDEPLVNEPHMVFFVKAICQNLMVFWQSNCAAVVCWKVNHLMPKVLLAIDWYILTPESGNIARRDGKFIFIEMFFIEDFMKQFVYTNTPMLQVFYIFISPIGLFT